MDIVRANDNEGGNNNNVFREYRKGNWTLQETMVLIEAKRMDEERRMKRHAGESSSSSDQRGNNKPAELRWKWVEDYCWRKGCLRSQTQCNDKWDNLMRDFKKVRDYEKKLMGGGERDDRRSYWKLEKSERKERSLPSNMLNQLYDALVEAVEKKGRQRVAVGGGNGGGGGVGSSSGVGGNDVRRQNILPFAVQYTVPPPPPPPPLLLPLPPPVPPLPPAQTQPPPLSGLPLHQPLPPVDSDTSHEHSDSPSKRRRRRRGRGEGASTAADSSGGGGGGGGGNNNPPNEEGVQVGNAISRSATIIAEAIQASEEREERRHREVMSMHQRRLQIEENQAENNRQGIHGLVDAVNKLANSIFALASRDNNNNNNNNNNETP